MVIDAPVDTEAVDGCGKREGLLGRRGSPGWNVGNGVRAGKARSVEKTEQVRRVRRSRAQPKGAFLVKRVDQRFAVVVIVDARAGANRGFRVRGKDHPEARGQIRLLLRPISWPAIRLAGRDILDKRLVDLP